MIGCITLCIKHAALGRTGKDALWIVMESAGYSPAWHGLVKTYHF